MGVKLISAVLFVPLFVWAVWFAAEQLARWIIDGVRTLIRGRP